MANDLEDFIPSMLALAVPVLRNNLIIPRAATREPVSTDVADQGDTVTITDVGDLTAIPVAPANVAPNPQDVGGSKRSVKIGQWYEVPFQMNDKELKEVENGFLPRVAQKAVIALATVVENYIISKLLQGLPLSVGTPGTAPFQTDLAKFFDASVLLDEYNVSSAGRTAILNPRALNNALQTRALNDASWRGNSQVMDQRPTTFDALGVTWGQTNSLKTRAQGTANGSYLAAAAGLKGARQLPIDTGTGTFLPGDTFTIAGDTAPYAVISFSGGVLSFAPGLRVNTADNAQITVVASNGVPNLLLQEDAFIFVNRPLASDSILRAAGGVFESITDPESGFSMRLELLREHKRVRWSFDMLWDAEVVNENNGVRIYG